MAGNATVSLYNGSGMISYEVWLQSISTSSNNQFSQSQTRDGITWVPIRRALMSVQFTIVWPLITIPDRSRKESPKSGFYGLDLADGFGRMQRFQTAIRTHQQAIANGSTSEPMVLNYYNNSDPHSPLFTTLISPTPIPVKLMPEFRGWIQTSSMEYIKFQNMYVKNYNMSILTQNEAQTPPTSMDPKHNVAFAPSVASQRIYGDQWVSSSALASKSNTIKGLPRDNGGYQNYGG